MKYLVLFGGFLALVVAGAFAQKSGDDEKTIRSLEQEWIMHAGSSQTDVAYNKRILAEKSLYVDPFGHLYTFTYSDFDKMAKEDPNVKSSGEIKDLKIVFYGPDLALATYKAHFIQTGHKDEKFNQDMDFTALDTWQKQHGTWKLLADTNTSTKPVLAEMYKVEFPGMPESE